MWIKICGITNPEDALAAVEAGADAVGFIFVPSSPRVVTRDKVSQILALLPSAIQTVGVVANERPEFLESLLRVCPLQTLQFHGEESPEEVFSLKGQVKLIKAIRVQNPKDIEQIPDYEGVDAILLDARQPGQEGAASRPFEWDLVSRAKSFGIPLIVAGGLNPQNVGDLLAKVHPFGVDVSSGVEAAPGRKDPDLIRAFIASAKQR